MTLLRKFVLLLSALAASAAFTSSAYAVVPDAAESMQERMDMHDRTFYTPPSMTLDQRRLQIAALSAFEVQSTDPGLVMDAYLGAGSFVTYYLHAETTWAWTGSEWIVSYRSLYTYTDGNQTESLEQTWSVDHWENDGRTLNTYDGSDRLATSIFQVWDSDSSAFLNYFKFMYTYTGGGFIDEVIVQNWVGGVWVNSSRGIATYSGDFLTIQLNQSWTGSTWVDLSRMVFSYSGSNLTEILSQSWNGSAWVDTYKTTNTYSGSNLTQSIYQQWSGSEWVNISRDDMQYDGSGHEIRTQGYNWVSNAWNLTDSDTMKYTGDQLTELVAVTIGPIINSVMRTTFEYDGADNLIEEILYFDFFGTLQPATRTTYYYTTSGIFDGDAEVGQPSEFDIGQNYPNPFNLNTVIPYSLSGDSHVRITICNILGQTMSTLVDAFQPAGAHTVLWDGRDANGRYAASGVYFTRVQVGTHSQVRKMVLLK